MRRETTGGDRIDDRQPDREEILAKLLESVNDLVWCASAAGGRLLFVNSAAERIYGRPLAELVADPTLWLEAVHPDDRVRVEENLRQLFDRRQVQQEYRIVRPDGQVRWLQDRRTVVYDESGAPLRVGGMVSDISEQKRAEEALRESEAVYHSLVENIPLNVLRKDLEGRIAFGNQRYCQGLRATLSELIGKTDFDLFPPELARKYIEDDRRVLETGEVMHDVEEHETRDGARIYVEVIKGPVRDVEGCNVGVQVMFWDVTLRKRAEEQLRAAKEAADAANRAKGDFLANMSHEIRTPMNAIIGMTDLVLDTELTPTQRDYLRMVQESGESLLMLINDILDFSKIEAGKLDLEQSVFDVHESLGDTMKALAVRAHAKGLELAFHIRPETPRFLEGDVGRLRQILVNLVGNAIKFTSEGEVLVEVEPEAQTAQAAVLHFRVRDTGIGIPPDKRAVIFQKFQQADSSTTRSYGGTGLGLAISSRLAELMGGRIWLESEVGRGSVFHFTALFGVAPGEAVDETGMSPLVMVNAQVLAVDDNDTNRRILSEMLRNWSMAPTGASSAREALDLMRQAKDRGEPFRLVLSDVHMPGVDGFTLAHWIRREKTLADAAIIMLTSGERPGDRERRRKLNVVAHLLKPVKQSELFDAIVRALAAAAPKPTASELAAEAPSQRLGPLRILLAEDNAVNQKLAVAVLERQGHKVTIADNGKEAVAAFQSRPFDLVLMDVQMPEMDGFEATRRIRASEAGTGRRVPILAMTAHAMKGDRERCLAAGMDEYVPKPVRAKQLLERFAQVVRSAVAPAAPPQDTAPTPDVDWAEALRTANGDRELLYEIVAAFLTDAPHLMAAIGQAIAAANAEALRRTAHTLKGSVLFLGASRLAESALRLETMGAEGDLSSAADEFASLEEHMASLILTLEGIHTVRPLDGSITGSG